MWVAKGRQGRQGFGVVGGVGWGEGCVGEGVCLCVCVCDNVRFCVHMCIHVHIYTEISTTICNHQPVCDTVGS